MNKKVLIIYTGGTIGMKRTESGYAPVKGYITDAIKAIPDLSSPSMPQWDLQEMDTLLDSSDMTSTDWNAIGKIVYDSYHDYDGFVILHGTDTMAYTASALSFMLGGLNKPVILTGSQIPLSEIRSDGRDNLITSLLIAGEGVIREVALYFSGRLLRGNRATKMNADDLVAFASPNFPPLAEVGITIKYNYSVISGSHGDGLSYVPFRRVPIGVIKVFPGIQFGLFESIMTDKLSGIVLETFGAGNIPGGGGELIPIIKKAFASGSIVTVCSQCPGGTVTLGVYKTSSSLKEAGAVSGRDMTTEAAVAKLYYLLSLDLPSDELKSRMEKNLRGELTEL